MCSSTPSLDKAFNHSEAEARLYKWWEESGFFKADPSAPGDPFVIVIPPPNVTGNLHMGHALDNTLQDILIRYHRMIGDNTLWLPGTDHAGIATQNVVERALAAEGRNREALGREKFIERVWEWKEEYGGNIVRQLRRLGASCDWSRERFTMDEGLSKAVREVFVSLYEEGLIYQDYYIINWCPRCRTALADLEVEHEDRQDHLYYVHYKLEDGSGALTVATTRPETIFGDTAVAVNPEDPRFAGFIGKKVWVPLTGRLVEVIADSYVDIEFGTGALKITPAHDPNDFQLGRKHKLETIKCIDDDGLMTAEAGSYAGQDRFECRRKMLPELEEKGLLEKIEPLKHAVGACYRCKTVIEPNLSKQWFVRTKPLAEKAAQAVRDGRTVFAPKVWEKTYFEWMDNIRDWCISRQLWWGHQIPAWFCQKCGETIVSREDPTICPCGGELERDPDVLDTWFSSGLWPFSTLGWPEKTPDLARYYPTTVLVTGFDIIFFWVARMMMLGIHFMKDVPFSTVIIHALVKDAEGQKMSKSKGNVVDPLSVIDHYGADSFRFTLCALAGHNRDIRLSDDRIAGYGKFLNKLWNAAKLVLSNAGSAKMDYAAKPRSLPDRWLRSRLAVTAKLMREHLNDYYYDRLADSIYQFVWYEFCDWYLEMIKPVLYGQDEAAKAETQVQMLNSLGLILRLLHPIMPFVTEELWAKLPGAKEIKESIMLAPYPDFEADLADPGAEARVAFLMDVTKAVRSIRADFSVPQAQKLTPLVKVADAGLRQALDEYSPIILRLIGAESIQTVEEGRDKPREAALSAFTWGEVWTPLSGHIDLDGESARLEKELAKAEKDIKSARGKLANKEYVAKAPEEIVAETRERLAEMESRAETLNKSLALLKDMR